MSASDSFLALPFLRYRCECCDRTFTGQATYRAGLIQCGPCATGDHRHARVQEAA